jgi:hypothetical protein
MDFARDILDLAVHAAVLLCAVLYIERRLTRLETQMEELLGWKRSVSSLPFKIGS